MNHEENTWQEAQFPYGDAWNEYDSAWWDESSFVCNYIKLIYKQYSNQCINMVVVAISGNNNTSTKVPYLTE